MNKKITPPEAFFGFKLGSDRKIARWDRIVEYYYQLAGESDCIKVIEVAKSTEGNPFLLTIISAKDNLDRLEELRQVNAKLADGRGLSEKTIDQLVAEGKAVICQSMSLHASEIGGTQMAPELAYDLLSGDSAEARRILENVIFLMVPCFNPDGQLMVTDWYNQWVGTEYEGCSLPWLYHKYAGHDNNRDAFALNLPESQALAKIMFRDWHPHAYQDHHHMGSYGPRLYIAPYCEPMHPYADPLVWREESWYGAHMAYKLEEEGKTGILNAGQFPGWAHMGFHWLAAYHNTPSMLTESANAKLASPLYIHPDQLQGADKKTMPEYEPQTNFPHPWPGGWWRLRDIVEQQKIAAWALLDQAARNRETILRNAYLKAVRQTERGRTEAPFAYIITEEQHDPLTVTKLIGTLLAQGIEVKTANEPFSAGRSRFPAGTYVIFPDQPKVGVVKTLLDPTLFPDNHWTRNPDGSPIIYDTATDTVAEFMGVAVERIEETFEGRFGLLRELPGHDAFDVSQTDADAALYLFDCRLNDSFTAVNRLDAADFEIYRLSEAPTADGSPLPIGSFMVRAPGEQDEAARLRELLASLTEETGVTFTVASAEPAVALERIKPLRVGIYQRYWGGSMDEGWTRLVLDRFHFPYKILKDDDFESLDTLTGKVDALILPSDWKQLIVDINKPDKGNPWADRILQWFGDVLPPEYRSGIGERGLKTIGEFVRAGGRLITFDKAYSVAVEACGLKLKSVVEGAGYEDFHCPGSTLRVAIDTTDPLAWGLPEEALILNWAAASFGIEERNRAEDYRVILRYPKQDLLQSGWLIGEKKIAGKAAMVAVSHGDGDVILFGFRPQFRAQTHGTFKLLFNCLYGKCLHQSE